MGNPLISKIKKVITEFNKFHGIEVQTQLISQNNKIVSIRFTGSFCYTCGFEDYFEDFKLLLEEKTGLKTTIGEISNIRQQTYKAEYLI